MIKNARVRFVVVAMLSVLLILYANVFILNFLNYSNIKKDADKVLSVIVENNGNFDETIAEENGLEPKLVEETKYFVVEIYEYFVHEIYERILYPDVSHISNVSRDDAIQYTINALNQNVKNGYVDNFRFEYAENLGLFVFIDCTPKFEQAKKYLVSSIIVAGIELVAAFTVFLSISKYVVKLAEKK